MQKAKKNLLANRIRGGVLYAPLFLFHKKFLIHIGLI